MHNETCECRECREMNEALWGEMPMAFSGALEGALAEFGQEGPFSETEELELALELLSVSSEAELDRFLGSLVKKAWSGIKKVGQVAGRLAKPLGGVLRTVAKTALPFVGGALGSFIPIPGVGTALGSALGGALSQALESEWETVSQEERELELARRFVRLAGTAAQLAADGPAGDPRRAVESALTRAARLHLPGRAGTPGVGQATSGRWRRRRNTLVVYGA